LPSVSGKTLNSSVRKGEIYAKRKHKTLGRNVWEPGKETDFRRRNGGKKPDFIQV